MQEKNKKCKRRRKVRKNQFGHCSVFRRQERQKENKKYKRIRETPKLI